MSFVGEAKSGIDLLVSAWSWFRGRRDPVRDQAKRLIDAFEAHGIKRQQIVRVLPKEFRLSPGDFSTADKLKGNLTPSLLDWSAEYLVLNRAWLDGTDEQPQQRIEAHKNGDDVAMWLQRRLEAAPNVYRKIYVWAESDLVARVPPTGLLSQVYVEDKPGLDGNELSRFWMLSTEWPAAHLPCQATMLHVAKLAEPMRIQVIGRVVPEKVLRRLESGRIFAAQAEKHAGRLWHPQDVVPRWPER